MEGIITGEKVQAEPNLFSNNLPHTIRDFIVNEIGDEAARSLHWASCKQDDEPPGISENQNGFGNLHRINDIRRINKFLEAVNRNIDNGQYAVVVLETKNARKQRLLNKYPKGFSYPYYTLDFLVKRVFPKWKATRKIYFHLTKGRNRVLSLTEAMGRLVCCGFEIISYKHLDDSYRTCIIARKIKEPAYDMQPSYNALIKLRRIGKNGKLIYVYKMRTMHPYSEYLQEFIYENHDLHEAGKFRDDFRTTSWGRVLRKYWIDELPMFINLFKGELKLFGVRPLSEHYFHLYPEDLRELRIRVKPGLVPPYYSDMPKGLEEIQESERRYLKAYNEKPIRTDLKYLGRVFVNIVFKGARSG